MAGENQRHRIELTCPECGHVQFEPALVVSTQCRSCRANYQVRDGLAVTRPRTATRLAPPRKDSDPLSDQAPVNKLAAFRRPTDKPISRNPLMRFLFREKPPREITCFNCGHTYTATAEAQSSQCPRCSGYISLRDYEISEPWNRRIQTRGDVTILKTGSVSAGMIQCHNLTVLGSLSGSVDCSGDFIIRSHGKILGKVKCRQLRVERGARVEFLNPVSATSAYIDGNVRGQISCTGAIILQKQAQLQGLVRAASLIVKPGAQHSGTIEIVQTPKP